MSISNIVKSSLLISAFGIVACTTRNSSGESDSESQSKISKVARQEFLLGSDCTSKAIPGTFKLTVEIEKQKDEIIKPLSINVVSSKSKTVFKWLEDSQGISMNDMICPDGSSTFNPVFGSDWKTAPNGKMKFEGFHSSQLAANCQDTVHSWSFLLNGESVACKLAEGNLKKMLP